MRTPPPTLSDIKIYIRVAADVAIAAREFVPPPADHLAAAFVTAWDQAIAQAHTDLVGELERHAAVAEAERVEREAEGARGFLVAAMRGETAPTATQIAAAEALVRATT